MPSLLAALKRARLGSSNAAARSRSYQARYMTRGLGEYSLSVRGLPMGSREATSSQKTSGTRAGSMRSTIGKNIPA